MKMFIGSSYKNTLLGYAIINRIDLLELLLSYNINVNMKDEYGRSPLYIALHYGDSPPFELSMGYFLRNSHRCDNRPYIIEQLITKGAEVDAESFDLMLKNGWNSLCLKVIQKKRLIEGNIFWIAIIQIQFIRDAFFCVK